MNERWSETPFALGLMTGGIISGALLGLAPVVLGLACVFAFPPESHADSSVWIVGIYALALAVPPAIGCLIGFILQRRKQALKN